MPNARLEAKLSLGNEEDRQRNTAHLNRLRESIVEGPPYCQGVVSLPSDDLRLFYGTEECAHRLNLANATPEQLQRLADSCQPATFGLNQEDVYDESYRKAGKLDKEDFLIGLDIDRAGLVDAVRDYLAVDRLHKEKAIRAELYKLNVYGPNSFFKAHVDTPRNERQFGSLVIVYPTPHEGGALVLRARGENEEVTGEWSVDSGALLAHCNEPSIAYIAFYSDVEHEVMPVTSGHRVTITYNLYWISTKSPLPAAPVLRTIHTNEQVFRNALTELLADPTFLPEGGSLIFGLCHKYPLTSSIKPSEGRKALQDVASRLKASDAMLYQVFKDFSFSPELKIIYDAGEPRRTSFRDRQVYVMSDRVLPLECAQQVNAEPLWETLCSDWGCELVSIPSDAYGAVNYRPLQWVKGCPKFANFKTTFIAYGNQAEVGVVYWRISLLVPVGPIGDRTAQPSVNTIKLTRKDIKG